MKMIKHILFLGFLTVFLIVSIPTSAFAADTGLSFSSETVICSISTESVIRKVTGNVNCNQCGSNEYTTLCINVKNTSTMPTTIREACVSIDGREKQYWSDVTIPAGQTVTYHLFYNSAKTYLTPGLHMAAFYVANRQVYTCRVNIGRQWANDLTIPTDAEKAACQASELSPYVYSWLKIDNSTRYNAFCVDVKADYLPYGTYCCPANFYMDLSSLRQQYQSVWMDGPSGYAGLQRLDSGKGCASILSFWDIYCKDASGKTTTIRAKRTYPTENDGNDTFGGEGTGAHTLRPYNWYAGCWYRMLLLCGTSSSTGNTTVEQWVQDLSTNQWAHMCTYDTGVRNSCFIGSSCFFLENFLPQYAGEVRSMELANIRIRTSSDGQWHDITSTNDISKSHGSGSWRAGADTNSFYMITTGVTGKGAGVNSATRTVKNTENGNPLASQPVIGQPNQAINFRDVPSSMYYAEPVSWAVKWGITSGTSDTTFSPNAACTREQIVTFLWRAYGSPEPKSNSNPFTDVSPSNYAYKAILWAVQQGITTGTSKTTFSPKSTCNRAQAVTFLWGAVGRPSTSANSSFYDVPSGAYYAPAVTWAVNKKITSGTGNGKFSPDYSCTRGQIVTFLYYAYP